MHRMRSTGAYLLLAFTSTWICWGLIAFYAQSSLFVMLNGQLLVAATMWLPGVAALIAARFGNARAPLGLRPRFRGVWGCWLAALLFPAAVTALGALVFFLCFPAVFDQSLVQLRAALALYAAGGPAGKGWLLLGINLLIAPFLNLLFAAGEEIGWRGFLYPRLAARAGRRKAAVVSGLIWGVWHAPIIAMGHNYGLGYPGWPYVGIALMCVFCVGFGGFLCWLRERAGSVWPAALAHGALNAFASLPLLMVDANASCSPLLGPAPVGLIAGIPGLLCGVLLIRRLAGPNPGENADAKTPEISAPRD